MPYRPWLEQRLGHLIWSYKWQQLVQRDIQNILTNTIPERNYAIAAPPRHGKTSLVTIPLPAYFLRLNPHSEVITAMHSRTIMSKISRQTRRIVKEEVGLSDEVSNVMEWESAIGGRYRGATPGTMIAGTGGDLLIADDLVPDRKRAESEVFRDALHDWWQDDFMRRRNSQFGRGMAPTVLIMTRWHSDDIWARVVKPGEWLIRRLPALYDPDEEDNLCPLGRTEKDQALCPGMWTKEDLLSFKANMSAYSWQALYQGLPTSKAGLFFDVTMFDTDHVYTPDDEPVEARVRYFDFAATQNEDAAYTATVLMAIHRDGTFTIEEMDRIQEGPGPRDRWQKRKADMDARIFGEGVVRQVEERQPGAAGKDRVRAFHRLMRGHSIGVDKIEGEGNKTTRADPFAASVAAGLVRILRQSPAGKPNPIEAFKNELRAFPLGKFKDWVDSGSGAHNWLTRRGRGTVTSGAVATRRERLERRVGLTGHAAAVAIQRKQRHKGSY